MHGLSNPCLEFKQHSNELCIHLHVLSTNEARVAVQCALRDLQSTGERSRQTAVVIVDHVGKGLGRELHQIVELGPVALNMLIDELKLEAYVDSNNADRLLVTL